MLKTLVVALFFFSLSPVLLAAQSGASGAVFSPNSGQASFGVAGMACTDNSNGKQSSCKPATVSACPVSLRVEHAISEGEMVETRGTMRKGAARLRNIGQQLRLVFTDARHPISRATVRVRGWTAEGRLENTSAKPAQKDAGQKDARIDRGAVRTLSVAVTAGAANLWVPGMTAVTWVELVSLQYADGKMWTRTGAQSCRVAADPFMLVVMPVVMPAAGR